MSSIFSRIVRGELPSYKLIETETVFSFLDINPVQTFHTLVVPKIEVDHFFDVPEPYYSDVFSIGKYLSERIRFVSQAPRVGSCILGWDVPHFHLHLMPIWEVGDLDFRKARKGTPELLKQNHEALLKSFQEKPR